MPNQKLVDYVKSKLNQGRSTSEIREALLNAGWPRYEIDEAFRSAVNDIDAEDAEYKQEKPTTPDKPKSRKKFYVITIVAIVIILAITASYIFSLPSSLAVCGDNLCNFGENYLTCPADCQPPQINATTAVVKLSPQTRNVAVGSDVSFDITISSVTNLFGYQLDLAFDPSILQFKNATEGAFMNKNRQDSTYFIQPKISAGSSKDYVTIVDTRMGDIGGVDGSGVLADVIFTAIGNGTSEMKLNNIKLIDANVKNIDNGFENGLVTVT